MAKTSRDRMKQVNKFNILNTIRKNGTISRVELAEITGQSRASVTNITARLIKNKLVYEKETKDSTARGRRRVMLALNPDAAFVAGVKVSEFGVSFAVTDMRAEVRSSLDLPVRTGRKPVQFIADLVEEGIIHCVKQAGLALGVISGIGIGIPGFVNKNEGVAYWTPLYKKGMVSLRDLVQEKFSIPVWVENDTNTVTMAHQWFGHGRGIDNFLVVTIEDGVGMGIVVNDKLYRGEHGTAAEFGHVVVEPGGVKCRCGKKGCIEAYVSNFSILDAAGRVMKENQPVMSFEGLIETANKGNERVKAIFHKAGEILGIGISGLIQIFSPSMIIISGSGVKSGDLIFQPMKQKLGALTNKELLDSVKIIIQTWKNTDWARGAASLALQEIYQQD